MGAAAAAEAGGLKWNNSFDGSTPFSSDTRWDVLGLGQAIVDFSATVDDDFIDSVGVPTGGRKVISVEERGDIIQNLDGNAYQVNAGGSLSNSLVALARLGLADAQLHACEPLRVGMAGSIGGDALGEFYQAKLATAGVDFLSKPQANSATGTVVVLTTPDAQRSFLSYPGTTHDFVSDAATAAVGNCRILVVEGYLWEMENAWEGISHAIKIARAAGTLVAMSAGDAGVVQRHRANMLKALELGVDVIFTNAAEANALMGLDGDCAEEAAMMLGTYATLGVVTDGCRGAYLAALGRVQHIEPFWSECAPVDTCGAGDAYAAGLLYGLLHGQDIASMGKLGARVASAVIGRHGARLSKDDALMLSGELAIVDKKGAALPPLRNISAIVNLPSKLMGKCCSRLSVPATTEGL